MKARALETLARELTGVHGTASAVRALLTDETATVDVVNRCVGLLASLADDVRREAAYMASEGTSRSGSREQVLGEVNDERDRQDAKWGTRFPGRPHDRWLTILAEEVGEAAEAILQSDGTPDKRVQTLADVRREVVQIAAVAVSWLEHGEWGAEQ